LSEKSGYAMMTVYEFKRGETIHLALEIVSGDGALVTGITSHLRRSDTDEPDEESPIIATANITYAPKNTIVPGIWTLSFAPEVSAYFERGLYALDARIVLGNDVIMADPVMIRIREPVTMGAS
jgi:hypothetical protein